jgi:polyvinyl alcohol dehydrogenase (cytochrome)
VWTATMVVVASCVVGTACGKKNEPSQPMGVQQPPPTVAPTGDLPCAVATVLSQHCAKCHGSTLHMGATVPMLHASDFALARGTTNVAAEVLVRTQEPARRMPPPPDPALTAEELGTLMQWINGGAHPDPAGCAVNEPAPPVMTAGSGGMGGTMVVGTAGTAGSAPAGTGGAGSGGMGGSTQMAGSDAPSPTGSSWSMFGHDASNTRDNPDEKTLSASNVSKLHELWVYKGAGTTSTPAVVDGIVYLPSWDGTVHALRADDGSMVWMAKLPHLIDSSPCVTDSTVYVGDDYGSLHALARADGKVLWSKHIEAHPEAHLWSSPVFIADANLVVIGVASGEEDMGAAMPRSFRGSVVAVDATSGDTKWQFYTTDDDASSGPGESVWGTPAVDTKRKLVYVGTGNAYEAPTGKYADSMLAINYETGMLAWSQQFNKDDVFVVGFGATGPDSDVGSTATLFSANGKDLVGIGVKNGIYYALDRDTGMMQWMTMLTAGSALGGVISASAYANDTVYVASNKYMEGATRTVALDAKTGMVRWEHSEPMITYGGVAHANGVTYVASTSGKVYALDAEKGTELWSDELPDSVAGSPTVANGVLLVPWGYQWTLRHGPAATGGLTAFGL